VVRSNVRGDIAVRACPATIARAAALRAGEQVGRQRRRRARQADRAFLLENSTIAGARLGLESYESVG
jgi:hypothetical protein